jgi:tRNA threonylcarbamoyladenosine biosynthesis protein TsaB
MNVLAIDTATEILSVALKTEGGEYETIHRAGLSHSEALVPSIQALCSLAGFSLRDLDLVVCMKGPGSFTGLRIGMATAKGIAFGLKIPLVSVPTLDFMAFGQESFSGLVLPIIDARRIPSTRSIRGRKTNKRLSGSRAEVSSPTSAHHRKFSSQDLTETFFWSVLKHRGHPIPIGLPSTLIEETVRIFTHCMRNQTLCKVGADSKAEGPLYIRKSEAELL